MEEQCVWMGNAGDAAPLGERVSELRIHYCPGYRVYYKRSGEQWIVLLAVEPSNNSVT
jgi:putative addiction module killer protein